MNTILCDVGGVLLYVEFDKAIRNLCSETGLSEHALMNRIFSSGDKDRHDRGRISPDDFYGRVVPPGTVSPERFKAIWGDIFTENSGMVDYMSSLKDTYRLIIASNTDPVHFEFFRSNYSWVSMFDDFGLSYRLNAAKPSPGFFQGLCSEFGIRFEDAVFVDDLAENVAAAAGLGLKSHLFTGVDAFRRFLESV